jgi:vacuolar-type H+-ATPase subunit E/Vma4
MAIKKDIIKDALTEAKKIEQFAFESAKKALEESLAPQIEEVVLNSLRELEKDSSEEKDLNEKF